MKMIKVVLLDKRTEPPMVISRPFNVSEKNKYYKWYRSNHKVLREWEI